LLAEIIQDVDPVRARAELSRVGVPHTLTLTPRKGETPVALQTSFSYDEYGRVRSEKHPNYEVHQLHNKAGAVLVLYDTRKDLVVQEFDSSLHLVTRLQRFASAPDSPFSGDPQPGMTGRFKRERFERDAYGRLARCEQTQERFGPDNTTPIVEYDRYPDSTLKSRRSPSGIRVAMEYDHASGELRKEYLVSRAGSAGTVDQNLVMRHEMQYDAEGHLTQYLDDLGGQHKFRCDSFGRDLASRGPDDVERIVFLDGLGRTAKEETWDHSKPDAKLLFARTVEYDLSGNLIRQKVRRLGEATGADGKSLQIDEWLTEASHEYDANGRRISTRGFRNGALTRFRYDGCDRLVRTESPEGDVESVTYEADLPVVVRQELRDPIAQKPRCISQVTLYDDRCNPTVTTPVGDDGVPSFSRAQVSAFDTLGRFLMSASPGLTRCERSYDSLDRLVVQTDLPLTHVAGEKPTRTLCKYDADGRVLRRSFGNDALALFVATTRPATQGGPQVQPALVCAAQVTEHEYDTYGRLTTTHQPDGLRETRQYGRGSMVEAITWAGRRGDEREGIHFVYDAMRRPTDILRGDQTRIQHFEYDSLGRLCQVVDEGNPQYPVTVTRRHDGLGRILNEAVTVGGKDGIGGVLPKLAFSHDVSGGVTVMTLDGLAGQRRDQWQRMGCYTDLTGRVRSLSVDNDQRFCVYEHVGQQMVRRSMPSLCVYADVELSSLLEPTTQAFRQNINTSPFCQLNYGLDEYGRVIACSMKLAQPNMERCQYSQHDAFGNLIADGAELLATSGRAGPVFSPGQEKVLPAGQSPGRLEAA
jgi:YD repeat-containing protein